MRSRIGTLGVLAAALAVAAVAAPAAATADKSTGTKVTTAASRLRDSDVKFVRPMKSLRFRDDRGRSISKQQLESEFKASDHAAQAAAEAAGKDTPVGTVRSWVAFDLATGAAYRKNFVLRRVGQHMEIWTAVGTQQSPGSVPSPDLQFPAGDCRNGVRTQVTDAQLDYLIQQYDNKILPVESKVFSVAPNRNGSKPQIPGADFSGAGDNVVTLVDNIRDANFYDTNNAHSLTFIAGFFSPAINALVDRNVMTIDGFDWLHRIGANPPDNPSTDLCTNAPARPHLYEGIFAHEYQHLLESYQDPQETPWVNEGLSDYAQTVTGYADPSRPITAARFDSHIQCFLGYLRVQTPFNTIPRKECGPGNSLTLWGDQGEDNILADYGAAYSMMEFLAGRYGMPFMRALHREGAEGFAGLQKVLDQFAPGTKASQVLHDWAAMIALDKELDGTSVATQFKRFTTPTLHASVLWDNPEAYQSGKAATSPEGAPPNGSDYVLLRGAGGGFLSAGQLKTLSFAGAKSLSAAVAWAVDPAPAGRAGPALYAGIGDGLDRSIAHAISVPTANPKLTFDTRWSTEQGFDSGFVQISIDGGKSWKSLGNADTTTNLDPAADPTLISNRPGFNGNSGGWRTESFDLSPYAGQRVLLGFRYFSDANTHGDGWWIDNISVGGTPVSDGSSIAGWRTYSQLQPQAVHGFTVQLISYTPGKGNVRIASMSLDRSFAQTLNAAHLRRLLGSDATVVAAIVTYDEPTEKISLYAPYVLKVNGVLQPGGG